MGEQGHEALVWLIKERGSRDMKLRESKLSSARVKSPPMIYLLLATGALKGCETSEGVIYFSFYSKLQLAGSPRSD